jgi:hypothetical protein
MGRRVIAFSAVLGLTLLTFAASSVPGSDNSYVEDFTSKEFCDTSATTAWWDTTTGELKLYPFELAHVGSIQTAGQARGVALAGDRAYVAYGDGGLQVFNIGDPTNPAFVAQVPTMDAAMDVVVAGDRAYVADGTEGLCVINIGSSGFGTSVNTDTPGMAEDVYVSGDYAYVADGDSGLRVFDIASMNPKYVGSVPTPDYAMGLDVSGDYAYVAVDDSGLVIIDIDDPRNPVQVGRYDTPNWAINVSVSGKYAFVADYGSGLQIIDVSDPSNPVSAGYCDTDGAALDVIIVGDYAYIADGYSGLAIIDITEPAAPTVVDNYVVSGQCWDVAVAGEHAYLAARSYGFQVVDICDRLIDLAEMGMGSTPGNSTDVTVDGNYAYVADMYKGIRIFDISNPGGPLEAGNFSLGTFMYGRVRYVAVARQYAYVAYEDSGVVVLDVSDPMNPTWAGSYISGGQANDLNIEGDYLYVGDGSAFFQVLDISDPANPIYVGSYDPLPGSVTGIDVDGNIACAVDGIINELVILDVSDPASPTVTATYTLGDPVEVVIEGDYAFVADYDLGVLAIDISDPAAPVLLDSITTPGRPHDIVIDGDYAVVADQSAAVTVLDISDPTDLVIEESLDIGICHGLTLAGDYIYAADQNPGLAVIKMYDRYFDIHSNTAQSLAFYQSSDQVLKVRLATVQSDWIGWWVTGDSGLVWTYVEPGGDWYWVTAPGTTLHWASIQVPLYTGVNPSCSDLTIEWLYEYALIDSIVDIPADQGGRVRIYFTRSGWDFGEGELPITTYNVWRRIDSPALMGMLQSAPLAESDVASDSDPGIPLCQHDGRRYLINEAGQISSSFPPGIWEVLGSFAAVQQDQYIHPAATLADSTVAGVYYSVYCISAHTTMPSTWYVSPPDSGYSIDNIAPAPPPGLRMPSATELAWDTVPDEDFQYYSVYGTDSPEFEDDPVLIGYTIDLGMDISGDIYVYYHVTATDYAGNEGSPSTVENAYAGLRQTGQLPTTFALKQNRPNPFGAETTIRFDLPEPAVVSLRVFDVNGCLIKSLVFGTYPPGHHSVSWAGDDEKGRIVSPGIYFTHMEAGVFKDIRKVIILR